MLDVDRAFIEFCCPRCSYPSEVQIREVRLEARVFCPNCKLAIQLVDELGSAEHAVASAQAAIADLEKTLKGLS